MNVILSIKPEFVRKIFSGEKLYEYRKVLFKQKVETVYIYASSPVCKIVGEFKIEKIIFDTPQVIWERTEKESGVDRCFFEKYFQGKNKGIALKIKECKKYSKDIAPRLLIPNFTVPQSFVYADFSNLEEFSQRL